MAQQQITLKINGMHCTSCSLLIDGDLEDTSGILSATTNYARQVTDIRFDDEKITVNDIINIVKTTGYTASPTS